MVTIRFRAKAVAKTLTRIINREKFGLRIEFSLLRPGWIRVDLIIRDASGEDLIAVEPFDVPLPGVLVLSDLDIKLGDTFFSE